MAGEIHYSSSEGENMVYVGSLHDPCETEKHGLKTKLRGALDLMMGAIDPTSGGIYVGFAEAPTSYQGFTDTPDGRRARAWSEARVEEIRKKYPEEGVKSVGA